MNTDRTGFNPLAGLNLPTTPAPHRPTEPDPGTVIVWNENGTPAAAIHTENGWQVTGQDGQIRWDHLLDMIGQREDWRKAGVARHYRPLHATTRDGATP